MSCVSPVGSRAPCVLWSECSREETAVEEGLARSPLHPGETSLPVPAAALAVPTPLASRTLEVQPWVWGFRPVLVGS